MSRGNKNVHTSTFAEVHRYLGASVCESVYLCVCVPLCVCACASVCAYVPLCAACVCVCGGGVHARFPASPPVMFANKVEIRQIS